MLDEIKEAYYNNADILKDWKKMSGNDLCFLYLKYKEENNPLLDNCLSAIIYKFWSIAVKAYHSQGIKIAYPEDCYNWLVDSIMYVLENHVWTDPDHSLYNDKKAPEKAINVVFTSTKINYFVAQTRQKRKIDATSISLDGISEEASDAYFIPVTDDYKLIETELVVSFYNKQKYFDSICLDLILNEGLLVDSDDEYTEDLDNMKDCDVKYRKLKKRLKSLDDDYSELFSTTYGLNYDDVKKSVDYVKNLKSSDLNMRLDRFVNELKHNEKFIGVLRDA